MRPLEKTIPYFLFIKRNEKMSATPGSFFLLLFLMFDKLQQRKCLVYGISCVNDNGIFMDVLCHLFFFVCRKIPRDLTEASLSGAGLSIVAALAMMFLFGMVGTFLPSYLVIQSLIWR